MDRVVRGMGRVRTSSIHLSIFYAQSPEMRFYAVVSWGMDIFDGMLFNFVAPIAIPSLLGIADRNSKEAVAATINYTGLLTSLLLIGWSIG